MKNVSFRSGSEQVFLVSASVPPGTRGWGAQGTLDLDAIRKLAR